MATVRCTNHDVRRLRLLLKSFAMGLAMLPLAATAQADDASCNYEEHLLDGNSVVIDANSGAVLSTSTQFPTHRERIDLYFVNKNPFGFTYRFDVKGTAIEEGSIKNAFKMLGLVIDPTEKKASDAVDKAKEDEAAKKADEAKAPPPGAPAVAVCATEKAKAVHVAIAQLTAERAKQLELVKANVSGLSAPAKEYDGLLSEITPELPVHQKACIALARKARTAIDTGNEARGFLEKIESSKTALATRVAALEKAGSELKDEKRSDCAKLIKDADTAIQQGTASVKEVEGILKDLQPKKESLESNNKLLTQELARSDSFVSRYPIGPMSEPTEFAIKVERTARADNTRTTVSASAPVRLGVARFSFSSGIAFGFADQKNYVRQASVKDGVVANIVGVDKASKTQVGVVGQLNGRIVGNNTLSFLWSLGASITQGENDTQFGLFTGPTLGFIDDRLFVTAAYHLHKEKRLAGGFKEGDVVPADLQGEIPTTEKTSGALLISVTYKFQ